MVAVAPAHAQSIDPRRIASCELAAESLQERVRPETESYVRYDSDAHYWSAMVERFVPDQTQREALLAEGRGQLNQALAQQDYLAAMTMVGGVLSQCNAGRAQLEAAAPHG
jgi:hypothetical protein